MSATLRRHSHFRVRSSWRARRISEDRWATSTVIVALLGLFAVLGFCMRSVTLMPKFGTIPVELPLIALPMQDPGQHGFTEQAQQTLSRTTPVVVLTTDAFYFGALEAFTAEFGDMRKKFIIRHQEGEPQLERLVDTMQRWLAARAAHENIPRTRSMILLPSGDIPMPIVIQVIAGLRKSPFFERVVLGTGLL